jgi:hypothetical protein
MIFSTDIEADPTSRHQVAVTWNDKEFNLYFDGTVLSKLKISDFYSK